MTTLTKRRPTPKGLKDPNQKLIRNLFPKRKTLRKSLALTYIPITHNVYYDGHSFRVRVASEGYTTSWNTSDKAKAVEYRDYLLAQRAEYRETRSKLPRQR